MTNSTYTCRFVKSWASVSGLREIYIVSHSTEIDFSPMNTLSSLTLRNRKQMSFTQCIHGLSSSPHAQYVWLYATPHELEVMVEIFEFLIAEIFT